jgi:hypothetical protein
MPRRVPMEHVTALATARAMERATARVMEHVTAHATELAWVLATAHATERVTVACHGGLLSKLHHRPLRVRRCLRHASRTV